MGKFYIASSAARPDIPLLLTSNVAPTYRAVSYKPRKFAMRGFYEFRMTLLTGTPHLPNEAPTIVTYALVLPASRHTAINPPGSGNQLAIPG